MLILVTTNISVPVAPLATGGRLRDAGDGAAGGSASATARSARSADSASARFVRECAPGEVPGDLIDPVTEYDDEGVAVVGGFVYRGDAIPSLRGRCVFCDFFHPASGRLFYLEKDGRGRNPPTRIPPSHFAPTLSALGRDHAHVNATVRTLVTGATGTLGRALLPRLHDAGHEVVAASRSPPPASERSDRTEARRSVAPTVPADDAVEWMRMDLGDGTGVREAVADADVVVHAATAPRGDTEAVDVEGTDRLLDAAADAAGVSNFVYVSIVGIEDVPYSYYEHKLTAERAVEASAVPSTVLRSTQFHPFVHEILEAVARLPVWPLPTRLRLQPVDVGEVADLLVGAATPEPGGRLDPVGGPEVRTVRELAGAYREARGTWRPIVRLPLPGATFSALRDGAATCPDRDVGTVTWEEWLETEYG